MPRKKTLDAEALADLGVERLAELLMDVAQDDPTVERRLRLELAGARGPKEAAREVSKRIGAIQRSRSFVERRRVRSLVADLETQRRAIVEQVADRDPAEGLRLMWRFAALSNSIFERIDDSDGGVVETFHAACADLGRIALAAGAEPKATADRTCEALSANHYGQYDHLITELAAALGDEGLTYLQDRMMALPVDDDGDGYPTTARLALMQIADARGDVDGFVAQYDEETRRLPRVSAEIARRLLDAGRAEEALRILDAARHRASGWVEGEWQNTRIEALDALGRRDDAQEARWTVFERDLSAEPLREYLRRYPGFDGAEIEERALAHARGYSNAMSGLSFLVGWPALATAAALVVERADELDGYGYLVLGPAAEILATDHPLAATLLLRAMIDFTLADGRSTRYRHAARHLRECAALAPGIDDFGPWESHEAYVTRLRNEHGRKGSFWKRVDEE